jgi:hypothetical protein
MIKIFIRRSYANDFEGILNFVVNTKRIDSETTYALLLR